MFIASRRILRQKAGIYWETSSFCFNCTSSQENLVDKYHLWVPWYPWTSVFHAKNTAREQGVEKGGWCFVHRDHELENGGPCSLSLSQRRGWTREANISWLIIIFVLTISFVLPNHKIIAIRETSCFAGDGCLVWCDYYRLSISLSKNAMVWVINYRVTLIIINAYQMYALLCVLPLFLLHLSHFQKNLKHPCK